MSNDVIRKEILLRAPLARVWTALTDSGQFAEWFGVKFEAPFSPGTVMRGSLVGTTVDEKVAEGQKKYVGIPFEFTIDRIEPQTLFSFRWHPFAIEPGVDYSAEPTTLVVFTLEEQAEGVKLTVTESGFDKIPLERRAKAFAANEGGWGTQMRLIEAYLGSRQ